MKQTIVMGFYCTVQCHEMRTKESHCLCLHIMCKRVQVYSSIIQHAQNHENITLDICNIDYKIWANSKGHLTFLKFQYLQAMQIYLNKLQNILFGQFLRSRTNVLWNPAITLPHKKSNHQSSLYKFLLVTTYTFVHDALLL